MPLPYEVYKRAVDFVDEHGTHAAAARALGMPRETLNSQLARAADLHGLYPKNRHIIKGVSTLVDADGAVLQEWQKTRLEGRDAKDGTYVPDPKKITKVSTLLDQQGKITQQWVSEKADDQARETLWKVFAEELARDIPRITATPAPKHSHNDLCAIFPVGDHHLGMYSWAPETGADYDLEIGERLLTDAMQQLVISTPRCGQAVIAVIGDFLHYDSTRAETPLHKNLLDADGRSQKMVQVAVRCLRQMVDLSLKAFPNVRLILEPGNHDLHTTTILSICIAAMYEKEPRLSVDLSPAHFHYFEFGKCLIGTHHGHGVKMESLPGVMACDQAEAWGRTTWRHWFTGHIHHKRHHDLPGCSVESLRILPPVDAYAAQKGYRSRRGMNAVVIHKTLGEVARHIVAPEMFDAA
ncbi:MAG TPA: hypothetical protein PLO16_15695 [Acidocella sp.]|nr:hypothetical protein [Acidocella sp.]